MAVIMVVDDSKTDRLACMEALDKEGHQFLEADSGERCLMDVKTARPGLIILDVIMQKKNGFQVCRALKKDPDTQGIPILLLTSKAEEMDRVWGIQQGADAYLTKPINAGELKSTVSRLLH
jgi:twitching motility two-component system response regulator PilH